MSKQRHLIPNITGVQSVEEEEECDRNVLLVRATRGGKHGGRRRAFFDPVWIFSQPKRNSPALPHVYLNEGEGDGGEWEQRRSC